MGQVNCSMRCIPCAYIACANKLRLPWNSTLCDDRQPRYQLPQNCLYSEILGELNEWNIILLKNI